MQTLNDRHLRETRFTQYFTIVYGILDIAERTFLYGAAGQPGPVLVPRAGEVASQQSTGHPIGLLPDPSFGEQRLELRPGDRLFLFSDGIPETFGPGEEEYGRDRLAAELGRSRGEDLDHSLDGLLNDLRGWSGGAPFTDDVSLLGVELTA
jgi:sigma-B regulation protein RsbU (phosphoserine phosphatase)